jgi:hypothetical protein
MPLAILRPSDWELPVFLHVLGATILLGAIATGAIALLLAWNRDERGGSVMLTRFGFRSLLFVALPAWFLMRIPAQWAYSEEGWDKVEEAGGEEPAWLGVGYITGDLSGPILLIGIVVAGLGARKASQGGGTGLARAATVITLLLIAMYLIAMWAMTTKPE